MAASSDFRDYVLDLLAPLGGVSARAMFGGFGLYCRGLIFALIADDILYVKGIGSRASEFDEAGMARFRPLVKGKAFPMPYYEVPPEALEDQDVLFALVRKALSEAESPKAAAKDQHASGPKPAPRSRLSSRRRRR